MSNAQRCRRYRDKLKRLRNATPAVDPVRDFLTQHPDTVAAGICARLEPEMARGIDMALRRLLWQIGNRPSWQPPTRAAQRDRLG